MKKHLTRGLSIGVMLYASSAFSLPLYDVVVALDGSADFQSVQQAIDSAPSDGSPYVIYIRNGQYQEKLEIKRDNIYLIGEDRDKTIITATTANSMLKPNGKKFGTTGSRTVNVDAKDFSARSLTIENGFDFPANQAKSADDPTRQRGTQAVALYVGKKGERVQFKDVNLRSYQDTLYLRGGHSYFDQSQISGTVDFIFGHGTGLFENSNIVARNRNDVKTGNAYGYMTAPATNIDHEYGLVFKNCHLSKEAGVPANSYGLGRPWHPTTRFTDGRYADPDAIGHSAYLNCEMDDHIYGWDKMSGKDINKNKIWFHPEDSRFWEYASRGAGAKTNLEKRPQLSQQQASKYTTSNILAGWQPSISLGDNSLLKGEVLHRSMQFPASILVKDSLGKTLTSNTDAQGRYQLSITGMTPPLLVSANDNSGESCLRSETQRSLCASALVVEVNNQGETLGNVNPFSDLIVSSLAKTEGINGPQLLVSADKLPAFSHKAWQTATKNFQQTFAELAAQQGISQSFDPVSYDAKLHPLMTSISQQVVHNRAYKTSTGLAAQTTLTDLSFKPIINLASIPEYTIDGIQLAESQQALKSAATRLFIVGDSTASNYEADVYPRMGWGQALDQLLADNPKLMVVNAARSGRSSRDYINGRWFSEMGSLVQAGDYLFIQFSHNDEKCNGAKKKRGPIDVANLCTYPNTPEGQPQFPQGKSEYSFQHSLERYLAFAKEKQLHPVLLTSVPRAKTAKKKLGVPLNPVQHVTKKRSDGGYQFYGSYTQTVKDTAKANHVPLLDMQSKVIAAANQKGEDVWKTYWLAVDPAEYPFYKNRTGRLDKPDTTHFQQTGAEVVAKLVLKEIKSNRDLSALAEKL
ncbi:pectinesterase family protein [Agarivorans sp. QJM3NY_29]|uniref:pectinesterase family protein n=1 Tax=unclassified Agarivorans TaxID=2636026 RepID=UPI003D7D7F29